MGRIFEIGPFRLDADAGVLTRDGTATGLGPRAVRVLTTLIAHAGTFVSKASIIDAVWPDVIVEEANLAVHIAAIRRVLGHDRIETLPRRGYRFVGAVTEATGERADAPQPMPSNLPTPLTSFIGRERELAEIKRLLPESRLLTLVGMGGIGKTRVALEAAAEVADAYRDGVWFVDLAPLAAAAQVAGTTAHVLGVQESTREPLVHALNRYLRKRQSLLILDNCEHLLPGCAQFAETLLQHAAGLTIVATSREPLRVDGERTYALQPLSLPVRESPFEAMQHSEAVRLFVERVQRALPDFALTADRAQAVAAVCVHLDGIPLALELAAARARSLSIEQIAARLNERFRLLTGGSRAARPRQQTLRATLDWSYDLLAEQERVALRRISVFSGGFTEEAAAAVVADGSIDEFAVIDLLSQLVARSLVIADTRAGGTRYRLLETTRAYAREKLDEVEETHICRRRHAQYFRALFERVPDDWVRMSDAEVYSTYVPELDHVRDALGWALGRDGDAAIGIGLAAASGALWVTLGLFVEGAHWMEDATRIEPRESAADQARLWLWLGRILDETPPRALPILERAIELYRGLDNPLGLGLAVSRRGRVLAMMGRFDEAEAALAESRPLLERAGPPSAPTYYLSSIAYLKAQMGDPAAARNFYELSLALDRKAGREFAVLAITCNLANADWALGHLDAAESSLRQLATLARNSRVGTKRLLGYALMNLSALLTQKGDLGEALAFAREGLPLVTEDGSAWVFADDIALQAVLAGRLDDGARLAGYAESAHKANSGARGVITQRARRRLDAFLCDGLAPQKLERLLAEGATMTEDEAHRLALQD